ncbi:MAG: hypothetical protein QMD65_03480 [Patescibacteria group bacterium]|nr:hypothetical protein [Patescibacteria group bacterium]
MEKMENKIGKSAELVKLENILNLVENETNLELNTIKSKIEVKSIEFSALNNFTSIETGKSLIEHFNQVAG